MSRVRFEPKGALLVLLNSIIFVWQRHSGYRSHQDLSTEGTSQEEAQIRYGNPGTLFHSLIGHREV